MVAHNEAVSSEGVFLPRNSTIDREVSQGLPSGGVGYSGAPCLLDGRARRVLGMKPKVHEEAWGLRWGVVRCKIEDLGLSMGDTTTEDGMNIRVLVATGLEPVPEVLESVTDVRGGGA